MSEWRECKLGDVSLYVNRGISPKYVENFGIPVINQKCIRNGVISNIFLKYHSEGKGHAQEKKLIKGDILINSTGVGTAGRVGIFLNDNYFLVDSHITILRVNKKSAIPEFVFYNLRGREYEIEGYAEGSTGQIELGREKIKEIDISLPPLSEQRAIAAILSSLDDKIDLLYRQNKTLEAMTETLFKQWFVVGAREDWEEVVITDFFEVRDGTHDSPKQRSFGKPLITSKHLSANKINIENAYFISEEDFENINKRSKVDENDILFSMIGTIGSIYFEQSNNVNYAIKNIGLFKTSKNITWCYYTYLWLKSELGRDFIHEHRSGSTQEYISLGSLRSIVFKSPPLDKLNAFNKIVAPYFLKAKNNITQIQTLETLRDTLLPKLMSGEVRVNTL